MDENKTDVLSESSTEQVVQEPVGESTVEQATAQETTHQQSVTPSPEGVNQEGDVDERGVSYKNRAIEYQRKLDLANRQYQELQRSLPEIVEQAVAKVMPQQSSQPQYTEEQLIQYKNEVDDPKQRAWAEIELRRLEEKKSEKKFNSILEERDRKDRFEREQQSALGEVYRKYPLAFNADGSWNANHPLTQKIWNTYNSRPVFKQDGMGLLGAADMAFAGYALERQPDLARETKQLKRQVKNLQKATLVEGGGQSAPKTTKSALVNAVDNMASKKYTSDSDLKNVAMELLKARGLIKSE